MAVLLIVLSSLRTNTTVTTKERRSETGHERNTPFRLKNIGRINIAGIRKITCLEKLIIRGS